jgi:hypothetical protein
MTPGWTPGNDRFGREEVGRDSGPTVSYAFEDTFPRTRA